MKKTYTQTTYVITHGLGDAVHFSKVDPGTTLSSGQPNVEEFSDEQVWKDRIVALGGDIARLNERAAPEARAERKAARPTTPEAKAALIAERKEARLNRAETRRSTPAMAPLTKEQRKNLTPEQRSARRLERQSNRLNGSNRFNRSGLNNDAPAPVTETPAVETKSKATKVKAVKTPVVVEPIVTETPVVEPIAVETSVPVVETPEPPVVEPITVEPPETPAI